MSKKRDKPNKRRRGRVEHLGGPAMVDPDDPNPNHGPDPHGAAVIPPVTEAMMDHAARAAAELADDVARGAVDLTDAADRGAEAAAHAIEGAGKTEAEATSSAAATAEGHPSDTADAFGRYGTKLLEAVSANVEAASAHAAALARAKSVSEAMAINAEHLRRQLDAMTGQGRELSILAQKALLVALAPFKGVLPRS